MSGFYNTRYSLDTIGQEPDEATLLAFYNLEDLEASAWPDSKPLVASPTNFTPTVARFDQDPLGIVAFPSSEEEAEVSLLYSEPSLNFYSSDFNPKKYLALLHKSTPYNDLIKGAEKLRGDIGERSESLRSLVKSNFDAFVGAKNTVDELHQEMRNNSIKNETGYGTESYGHTLSDAIKQADMVFGPIMERTSRSEKIRSTMSIVERYKFFFNLPSSMLNYIKTSKYDSAVRDYKKGRHLMRSASSGTGPLHRLFEKVWLAVQESVSRVHESIFLKLDNPWTDMDIQIKHINYLLQLDCKKDPVVYYLENQHSWIIEFVNRSFTEHLDYIEFDDKDTGNKEEQVELQKRAAMLVTLLKQKKPDAFSLMIEKLPCSSRWRSTLSLVKILGEVLGKTVPELFKFINQFQTNELYNKTFEKQKADAVWAQMTEEIVALLAITVSKLLNADAMPLPRRSDKTRHFDIISDINQKKLPPLPVDINCYIVGHYATQMAQELSLAVVEAKSLPLSRHAQKLLMGVFSTFRSDLASLFCDSWVQDTRGLFLIPSTNHSFLFYEHQYKCISIIQTLVQTTSIAVVDMRPEADPIILESAIPSLILSTQSFLDGIHYMGFSIVNPKARDKESQLVSTLGSLISTKEHIKKLLGDFETKLELSKRLNLMEIKTSEKVLDSLFFDTFIGARFTPIQYSIQQGILYGGFNWETSAFPKEIRPYVYEVLMSLVVIHAEIIGDALIKRVMSKLTEMVAQEFLTCFRKLDQFSKPGALQATLEMEFVEQTLQPFSNARVTSIFKVIYSAVQQGQYSQGQPPFQNVQDKELQDLEKLISTSRHTTRTQFACFTSNK